LDLVRRYERALGEPIQVEPGASPEEAPDISPSGVFRTLPPGAIIYRLEGWMPESIAVIKLQGFVKSAKGRVTETIPGLVRIRMLHPEQPQPEKSKSGIFSMLGKSRPPQAPPRLLELEVHMEKKDPVRPNLLAIALVMYSRDENISENPEVGKHCDKLCKDICSFLMAKPLEM